MHNTSRVAEIVRNLTTIPLPAGSPLLGILASPHNRQVRTADGNVVTINPVTANNRELDELIKLVRDDSALRPLVRLANDYWSFKCRGLYIYDAETVNRFWALTQMPVVKFLLEMIVGVHDSENDDLEDEAIELEIILITTLARLLAATEPTLWPMTSPKRDYEREPAPYVSRASRR